ncbi:exopolysaccharide biosynthesis protein [Brevundimonas lutea]|uniref:exopolysaccharide biosynthesis protein n=1 Tax=Brevundimonas lutea TaxID=2293980 RepID=UPI000F043B55|nr:exopolysaccharide biosynthesis protein [Brevundimonas lutea]
MTIDTRPFSQVLEDLGQGDSSKLTLDELVRAFGERGIGALMLFLGLLSAVVGAIPGSTTIIGIPMLLIVVQLAIRRDELWLPRWALKESLDRQSFRQRIGKVLKPLRYVERISRPRLPFLTGEVSETLIGVVSTVLCLLLMLPLIFFNLFPSIIIAIFGFGLMQRDGVAILIGWLIAAGFSVFVWLAWEGVSTAAMVSWEWLNGLF